MLGHGNVFLTMGYNQKSFKTTATSIYLMKSIRVIKGGNPYIVFWFCLLYFIICTLRDFSLYQCKNLP